MDGDQRLMLYWIEPGDVADCLAAKPELAEKFAYITRGRSRRHKFTQPTKQALGRANLAFAFQETQLIDTNSVPFVHLLYLDKSFSRQHSCHNPVYGDNMQIMYIKYAFLW